MEDQAKRIREAIGQDVNRMASLNESSAASPDWATDPAAYYDLMRWLERGIRNDRIT